MRKAQKITQWQEGRVDPEEEHFELRYGSSKSEGWDDWIPVVRVGAPQDGIANVQFLVDAADPQNSEAVNHVKKELQFYLIDLDEPNPWLYAQYHCGTYSNAYSDVHWSYFNGRESGSR